MNHDRLIENSFVGVISGVSTAKHSRKGKMRQKVVLPISFKVKYLMALHALHGGWNKIPTSIMCN